LLAVKDEWEVARLYCKPSFKAALEDSFDGETEMTFYFGAWPFGGTDPKTGKAVKGAVKGKTAMRFFRIMNRFRHLRGTRLDPFRNGEEAVLARQLLADYEADIDFALAHAGKADEEVLVKLLDLPEHIRGYGHVRLRHAGEVAKQRAALRRAITPEAIAAQ